MLSSIACGIAPADERRRLPRVNACRFLNATVIEVNS